MLREVMEGNASEAETAAFLMALRTKGETVQEIAGLAATMRELALPVEVAAATWSTRPARAADGRPSTSRPPRRSSRPERAAGSPSTAIARPPASAAPPTCSRRSGRASTWSPTRWPPASRRSASASCSRRKHHAAMPPRRAGAQGARRAHDLQLPRPADQSGRRQAPGDRRVRPLQARDARAARSRSSAPNPPW